MPEVQGSGLRVQVRVMAACKNRSGPASSRLPFVVKTSSGLGVTCPGVRRTTPASGLVPCGLLSILTVLFLLACSVSVVAIIVLVLLLNRVCCSHSCLYGYYFFFLAFLCVSPGRPGLGPWAYCNQKVPLPCVSPAILLRVLNRNQDCSTWTPEIPLAPLKKVRPTERRRGLGSLRGTSGPHCGRRGRRKGSAGIASLTAQDSSY